MASLAPKTPLLGLGRARPAWGVTRCVTNARELLHGAEGARSTACMESAASESRIRQGEQPGERTPTRPTRRTPSGTPSSACCTSTGTPLRVVKLVRMVARTATPTATPSGAGSSRSRTPGRCRPGDVGVRRRLHRDEREPHPEPAEEHDPADRPQVRVEADEQEGRASTTAAANMPKTISRRGPTRGTAGRRSGTR